MNDKIVVKIEYLSVLNYALYHNRIPICEYVDIQNLTDKPITDVKLSVSGDYMSSTDSDIIPQVAGNDTVRIKSFDISPDAEKLASLTEGTQSKFKLSVSTGDEVIFTQEYEIKVDAL